MFHGKLTTSLKMLQQPSKHSEEKNLIESSDLEQEIKRIERERTEAYLRRDVVALDRTLPDNFAFTRSIGIALNKAQMLQAIKDGDLVFESINREVENLLIYPNAVVARGNQTVKGLYKGQDIGGQYHFNNIYLKQQDRWVIISADATRIAKR